MRATVIIPARHPLFFLVILSPFKDETIRTVCNNQDSHTVDLCKFTMVFLGFFSYFLVVCFFFT